MSRFFVYVAFDVLDGSCVYVGQTGDYRARMTQHRSKSAWMKEPVRLETFECESREQAVWLEGVLIALLDPRANKVGREPARTRWRQQLQREAMAEPREDLFCICDQPRVDALGECWNCRRKPADLLRLPS